jgi:replication fork protection complex subunit Csm3/Swi3
VDLDRVLQVYQFWTHKLYPKTRFKETVDRVEKLCHSKRMQVRVIWFFLSSQISIITIGKVALSVWRDEANGLVNGAQPPAADDNNDSDSDSDSDRVPRGTEAVTTTADEDASSSSRPSSPARSRLRQGGGASATTDSDRDGDEPHLSSDASHPPPSPPDQDEATIELDALLEVEKASHASTHIASTSHVWKTSNGDAVAMDEDEDLWDSLDTGAQATVPVTVSAPPAMDNDEEMWDIMDELEQEKAKETAHRPDPVQVAPATGDAQADNLDDMYI